MENYSKLQDILKGAILLELRAEAFYRKISETTEIADIRNIFDVLAKEEVLHTGVLRDKYGEVARKNEITAISLPDDQDESAVFYVLSDSVKNRIASAGFEAAAISAAIDMESRAIKLYSESAEKAEDINVKNLFLWLAEWERGHHKLLFELDRDLKERIWNDSRFWPF
jgi:rubrerythrin